MICERIVVTISNRRKILAERGAVPCKYKGIRRGRQGEAEVNRGGGGKNDQVRVKVGCTRAGKGKDMEVNKVGW